MPDAISPIRNTPVHDELRPKQNTVGENFGSVLRQAVSDQPKHAKADPQKLADAARQFEALMIGQILKTARESGSEGWMGSGEESSAGTAIDMAQEFFGQAIANAGGLGIAKIVTANLTRR